MITVIKIILIIVAAVFLLVVLAVLWFLRKIRTIVKAEMNIPGCPPCRVNLEPEANPQWRNPAVIEGYAREYRALGFEEIGAFSIPEMSGLQLQAFVHPAERLYGIIYDHKTIEPTFDVCCDFHDGTGLSATNSDAGRTLDKRPDYTLLWLGKNSVREVFEEMRKHPQPAARQPVSREGFVDNFKTNYVKGMNWRLKKGGTSREEIRRQAEQSGHQLDEEGLEEAYKSLRASYLRELQAGCVAQYLDEQRPPIAEWESKRTRVFAIAETFTPEEVLETIKNAQSVDEEQEHLLAKVQPAFGETGVDVMEKILAQNIASLGITRLGDVSEPVRALILLAPVESPVPMAIGTHK